MAITRQKFLQQSMALSAGTAVMGYWGIDSGWWGPPDLVTFDLHAHPGRFYRKGLSDYGGDAGVRKTIGEMNEAGLSGAFFSTVVDTLVTRVRPEGVLPSREFENGEAWKEYKRQITALRSLCRELPVRPSTTVGGLTDPSRNEVAAFFACEGGDFLQGEGQLDEVYDDGVRSIQLVHYAPSPLGDLQTSPPQHNGLSPLGKEVVRKMNRLGMVIDVAHASHKTVLDVAAITNQPLILSHSILKLDEDRPIGIRAITREHAKIIKSTRGVIGAWPSGFNSSFDDYIDNIMRLIDVVGVDYVGLGTDMDSNYKPVLDSYLQLGQWREALKARGLTQDEVKKIAGGNVVRVLQKVLK